MMPPEEQTEGTGENPLSATQILDAISTQEARLPWLKDALAKAEAQGLDVSYPRNDLTVESRNIGSKPFVNWFSVFRVYLYKYRAT